MTKKKYKIATLGCRTNQYESQAYADQLKKKGFCEAKRGERADICIVNTCTVTVSADKRSFYQIRKLSREYQPDELIVTGCLAERERAALEKLPVKLRCVPNARKETLLAEVFPEEEWPEFAINHFQAHTRAFVKVQDGCNSYCSYCVIPFVRGRSRSRPVAAIVREVEQLIEQGYREVVLTGINIGDFDGATQPATSLADLVRTLDRLPGLARLRLSSIDPDEVDDALLDAIIFGEKTCHSMHIVLQAGSNVVLKRMRRKYTKQDFFQTVSRLKAKSDRFTFTTDVIVGFPGETDRDFAETLAVVREVQFAKVHIFPYSDRPKTRASRMDEKTPVAVIQQRKQQLNALADQMAFEHRMRYVGSTLNILIEGNSEQVRGDLFGHSDNFLPVYVPKTGVRPNEIVRVTCTANQATGLKGEVKW
ncbi:MAG: tRNA (N(6)-L-threonylcarbamoyladenosine(37)-C(2))-methylthiotransferase MtaB [Chlamydiota bacterium]